MTVVSGRPYLLVAISVLLSLVVSAAQTITYKVVAIGSPFDPPGYVSTFDLNNHGAVAAEDIGNGRPDLGYVWKGGKATPTPTLGGTCGRAGGINDLGQVVGMSCLADNKTQHAFLLRNRKMIDITPIGSVSAGAGGINRNGQVVGGFLATDGSYHGFVWQKKKWSDLGFLGGSETFSYDISESGVVTGQSDISNDPDPVFGIPPFHGFTWATGVLTDLGQIFGSDFSYSVGVDAAGRVTGVADVSDNMAGHAYLWDHGTVTDLSPYGDAISSWSNDVNRQGDIVGTWGFSSNDPADGPPLYSITCPCYAVVWHDGQPLFLNSVVDPNWALSLGLWINDRGEIVAWGSYQGGAIQTVLLKPIAGAAKTLKSEPPIRKIDGTITTPRGFRRERDGRITMLQ